MVYHAHQFFIFMDTAMRYGISCTFLSTNITLENAFDDILDQNVHFLILSYDDIKVFISGVATISKNSDTINHCKSTTFYNVFNKF